MWVFLGMETIANIKYRSHVDSDSCLLAVCRWLIPHEVAPQQSFTMLQPANAKVIIKNGTTKNNHIYFILQFDPLKHSINNSSCNLTYTPNLLISLLLCILAMGAQAQLKPRVVILTDIGQPDLEPDDTESLVHLLCYADQLEIGFRLGSKTVRFASEC